MNHIDTIVIGLGGMGSAAAWACAQRGQSVLGLEQFPLVHQQGSSHGYSRIIREAYYEHPAYVPLVRQAYECWATIEQLINKSLLTPCQCANIGRPDSEIIKGVKRAASEHNLAVEHWSAEQLQANIPALRVPDDYVALVETNAGWLKVEDCVRSMQTLAIHQGAKLHSSEKVLSWACNDSHVTVTTDHATYLANHLIVTAGPWSNQMLTDLGLPLRIMRQLQLWFTPPVHDANHFRLPHLPIFMVETPTGYFYGIPSDAGPGIKIAQHYGAPELTSPEQIVRHTTEYDLKPIRTFLQAYMPNLADAILAESAVCIYTLSPDRHFIIDRHPHYDRVALACGFSGHGFKFVPVVGEMLADLLEGMVNQDVSDLFSIQRLIMHIN